MKKLFLILVAASAVVTSVSAEVSAIPREVLSWYTDGMGVYAQLVQDIDAAETAAAASVAFDRATASIEAKKLRSRHKALEAAYPEFFLEEEEEDPDFVPPAEWMDLWQKYAETLERYGTSMEKVAVWYDDSKFVAALERFSEALNLE